MIYINNNDSLFNKLGLSDTDLTNMNKTINNNYNKVLLTEILHELNTSYIMLYGKDYSQSCIIMPNEIKYKHLLSKLNDKDKPEIYHSVSDKVKHDLDGHDYKMTKVAEEYDTPVATISSLSNNGSIGYITHSTKRNNVYFIKLNELTFGYNFEDAKLTDKQINLIKKTYDEKDLLTINNDIGATLAINPASTKVTLISCDLELRLPKLAKKYTHYENTSKLLKHKFAEVDYSLKKLAKQQKTTAEKLINNITDLDAFYDCLDSVYDDEPYSDYMHGYREPVYDAEDYLEVIAKALLPGETFIELKDLFKEED